ncbi:N-alpha-acetyltransferase 38, NatC auxiliary subunit-like [Watersipora subatra]|uniref:N-alpha-acetyltransferase 38, NatC auxiliary subunit-like n=1 Tax=Watersipora subatra TaxID=2589382 RepID=UPI00355AE74F
MIESRDQLRQWLNHSVRVEITDGRVLIGTFTCTDNDANIILGQCDEYLPPGYPKDPRKLGLAMVPGRHILKLEIMEHKEEEIL